MKIFTTWHSAFAAALSMVLALPALHATTYNFPPDMWPLVSTGGNNRKVVFNNGDIANVLPGASLTTFEFSPLEVSSVEVNTGAQFKMTGGYVDPQVTVASGASATFSGGTAEFGFNGLPGSSITYSGTLVGFPSTVKGSLQFTGGSYGSILNLFGNASFTGGSVAFLGIMAGANATLSNTGIFQGLSMSGGHLAVSGGQIPGEFSVQNGVIDASGGAIDGGAVSFYGGTLNLIGSSFRLNGIPIPGLLPNVTTPVPARGVTLSGMLQDGTPFSFELDAVQNGGDYFSAAALVTVRQAPEPATLGLGLLGLTAVSAIRRKY